MLLPLTIACAAGAIATELWWPAARPLYGLLKVLTTLLVIAHALRRAAPEGAAGPAQRRALLAGLLLSLLGDVALLWPREGFLPGLVAFLLAHGAYLVAFTRGGVGLLASRAAALGYALLAAAVLAGLWPGVPAGLRGPVLAYVVCLAAMAAQTAAAWRQAVARGADAGTQRRLRGAALGGALFLLSDALLATNRFAQPLPAATLWILGSYWAAQWLLAGALPPRRQAGRGAAAPS